MANTSTVRSMTGYATLTCDVGTLGVSLEIKSVNSRFLDLGFRLSEELRALEMPLRERIGERVGRGKVEVRGYCQARAGGARMRSPNTLVLDELTVIEAAVRARVPQAASLTVAEILRWPGVLDDEQTPADDVQREVLAQFASMLDEFIASREREGAKLAGVLRANVAQMRTLVAGVEPRVPQAIAAYQERLAHKLREAVAALDEDRIRQEVGVFAAKVDVAEELARLRTHLDEVIRVLDKGGAVGKRLDFLMQELNREANTLASKSVSTEVTSVALELKLLIEQMREQVQNLE
jgi:uncharacterized protein (TIGR00255 family)